MTECRHIGFYCGLAPDVIHALREARRRWPHARITAVVPPALPLSGEVMELADDTMVTERSAYSFLVPHACWRLTTALREQHFDCFVTLFKTLQQRLLAVASGAARAELWRVDSRISLLETTWSGLIWGSVRRQLGGRLRRVVLLLYTCAVRVRHSR